jgi:DNA-binding response OmpR family regulator
VDVAGRLGHRACGVADAQSALDRVAVEVPCLVLLDLDRGALELCRELVDRLGPRSPVIISAASTARRRIASPDCSPVPTTTS